MGGGEVNSRTTNMINFLSDIDDNLLAVQENPDNTKNDHMKSCITFLKDNWSVILNIGRVTLHTTIILAWMSVLDYLFAPIDHFNFCMEIKTAI